MFENLSPELIWIYKIPRERSEAAAELADWREKYLGEVPRPAVARELR